MVPVKKIINAAQSVLDQCYQGNIADTHIGLRYVRKFCGYKTILSHQEVNQLACELDDTDDWIAIAISSRLMDLMKEYDSFKTYSI